MRMHSYGKCSPNIFVGAAAIFCVILFYNYWMVSSVNRDLTVRIHMLEQQAISLSKSDGSIRTNLQSVLLAKEKIEAELFNEQKESQRTRDQVAQVSSKVESVKSELEKCKTELVNFTSKKGRNDEEVKKLKRRIVSLEAETNEKASMVAKLTKELSLVKKEMEKSKPGLSNKISSSKVDAAPVNEEPVLLNDPAETEMKPKGEEEEDRVKKNMSDAVAKVKEDENEGGEVEVLQPPKLIDGNPKHKQNLDAQEDENVGHLKDDNGGMDDQAPDGSLPSKVKQNDGIDMPPVAKHVRELGGALQSIQDGREAAHLQQQNDENDFN